MREVYETVYDELYGTRRLRKVYEMVLACCVGIRNLKNIIAEFSRVEVPFIEFNAIFSLSEYGETIFKE